LETGGKNTQLSQEIRGVVNLIRKCQPEKRRAENQSIQTGMSGWGGGGGEESYWGHCGANLDDLGKKSEEPETPRGGKKRFRKEKWERTSRDVSEG